MKIEEQLTIYLLLSFTDFILFQVYAAAAAQAAAGARISGFGGHTWSGGRGLNMGGGGGGLNMGGGGGGLNMGGAGMRPGFVFVPGTGPQFVNLNAFTGAPGWGQPFQRRGFM